MVLCCDLFLVLLAEAVVPDLSPVDLIIGDLQSCAADSS